MNDDMIMPVRHTTLSGTGATAAGAIGGGLKGGIVGYLATTGISAVLGAGIAAVMAAGGLALIPTAAAGVIGWAIFGGVAGAVAGGTLVAPAVAVFTGLFGGVKGGAQAANRVSQEKSAAVVMDAQVAAYQSQQSPAAQTTIYTGASNDNKYSFPAQGSAMNAAGSSIQASSAENMGLVSGQQLQRA